jgi:hypothetical protein
MSDNELARQKIFVNEKSSYSKRFDYFCKNICVACLKALFF